MAGGYRVNKGRIVFIDPANKRQGFIRLFHKVIWLSENDQIPVIALFLEEPQGNRIRYAPVKKLPVADLHRLRDNRHRRGCHEPVKVLAVTLLKMSEDCFPGLHICASAVEFHRVCPVSWYIE